MSTPIPYIGVYGPYKKPLLNVPSFIKLLLKGCNKIISSLCSTDEVKDRIHGIVSGHYRGPWPNFSAIPSDDQQRMFDILMVRSQNSLVVNFLLLVTFIM